MSIFAYPPFNIIWQRAIKRSAGEAHGKLSLLVTTDDAEQAARAWMQKKYGMKLGRVKFVEVARDNGVWTVKANVKLAAGVLLIKPHVVQIKIDAATNEIIGYSEAEVDARSG